MATEENTENTELVRDDNNNENLNKVIDYNNLTLKNLKDICRQNKLKIKGRKDELIIRITEFESVNKL